MLKLSVMAFLGLICTFALAEDDPCDAASKQAIALCASNKAAAADAVLNGTYQKALAAAGVNNRMESQLISTQRQWLKFMNTSCKLEQSFSISDDYYWTSAAADECIARLSLDRAKTLEYYACVFSEGAASAQCRAP